MSRSSDLSVHCEFLLFEAEQTKARRQPDLLDFLPEGSPVPAVITKIDRMKTRQGDSLFLKVDVGGETVRVFGRPEELAERLEAAGYDIPASEVQAGLELNLPCLVITGQGSTGYKIIQEFLPEAA